MEIRVEEMNYGNRLIRAMIWPIALGGAAFGVSAPSRTTNSFDYFLALTIILLSFIRHLNWYKYYVTKIDFKMAQVRLMFMNMIICIPIRFPMIRSVLLRINHSVSAL